VGLPRRWPVAKGTSAPAAWERALCDIVPRPHDYFEYRTDLGRSSDANDDATAEQDHKHAIRAGGIRPGAGYAAQAGGRLVIKKEHPTLQVAVYDGVEGVNKIIELP
jgi:hypothetical protein